MAAAVAVTVVLRFVTTSPLWLDEALSASIAALPVGDLLDALRHDGHPPLYYLLLHGWTELVGDGDAAMRVLSGLLSVAALPLAHVAGRRRAGPTGGLAVVLVVAVAPWSLRYATEVRMYSLVFLVVLAAWLLADDLRRGPDRWRWAGLAVLSGVGLLTHYWVIYALVGAGSALAWGWWRHGRRDEALRIGTALAAGGVLFLPWLGSFLYQVGHTGTPWGTASRPTRAVVDLAVGLGGRGTNPEAVLFGIAVLLLALGGLTVARQAGSTVELDLRTTPLVRAEVAVSALVFTVGLAAGAVSAATFMPRYAAAFLPMVLIAAGVGLALLPVAARRGSALVLLVLAAVGGALNVIDERSQGEDFAARIEADGAPGDVVAFCPDQLGPSTVRYLDDRFDPVGIPTLERPDRIDWVDYADRNESADPVAVAEALLERAGSGSVWLVNNSAYRTYEDLCDRVLAHLAARRPDNRVAIEVDPEVEENATLYRFAP